MNHLTDAEFVDLLEGRLVSERQHHADGCAACQSHAVALGATLERVRIDKVPEPSPLFWNHFSERVARAVDAEGAPSRLAGWLTPARRWSMAAAVLVLLIGLSWRFVAPEAPPAAAPIAATALAPAGAADGADDWLGELETDEAWAIVRTAADDLAWEDVDAAGITVRPDSAEHVAMAMTAEERTELARLIEDELRRSGS